MKEDFWFESYSYDIYIDSHSGIMFHHVDLMLLIMGEWTVVFVNTF